MTKPLYCLACFLLGLAIGWVWESWKGKKGLPVSGEDDVDWLAEFRHAPDCPAGGTGGWKFQCRCGA